LNWETNPVALNISGYLVSEDQTLFPIFVTYHKKVDISESIKYEDGFESSSEFEWETKNLRSLTSPEVKLLKITLIRFGFYYSFKKIMMKGMNSIIWEM